MLRAWARQARALLAEHALSRILDRYLIMLKNDRKKQRRSLTDLPSPALLCAESPAAGAAGHPSGRARAAAPHRRHHQEPLRGAELGQRGARGALEGRPVQWGW